MGKGQERKKQVKGFWFQARVLIPPEVVSDTTGLRRLKFVESATGQVITALNNTLDIIKEKIDGKTKGTPADGGGLLGAPRVGGSIDDPKHRELRKPEDNDRPGTRRGNNGNG